MELYFVDVGQGTCNVLVLGDGKAIVIDCGPRGNELLTLLERLQVREIERLIISHNDADHSGGAAAVLTQYRNAIGEVWFVHDTRLLETRFWKKIQEELTQGHLRTNQLVRLEKDRDDLPRLIFERKADSLVLKLFAPTFGANLQSHVKKSPNSTSGIVVLMAHERCIVYAGDAGFAEWTGVFAARRKALRCDIMSVPHHGGKTGTTKETEWIYTNAVIPRYAVISVGSANRYHHPQADVVRSLSAVGTSVLCTQITERCCGDLEAFRRKSEGKVDPGRSVFHPVVTKSGRSQHVACAGTLLATCDGRGLSVQRFNEHQTRVDELDGAMELDGHPLCRRAGMATRPLITKKL